MVVRKLTDIRAETVCNQFKVILDEFGIPDTIVADCGAQYVSESFKQKCRDANIDIQFSSQYHHQANSVAERAVGTVKNLWRKAYEDGQDRQTTALWMYRITPLDDHLPSRYELLFSMKPKTFLPSGARGRMTQSVRNERDIMANQKRQEDQARFYRAGDDRQKLNANESISIYNTIKKIWEPGTVVRQAEPRTYVVNLNGRELFRTREHLKPRRAASPPDIHDNILVRGVVGAGQPASQSEDVTSQEPTPPAHDSIGTPGEGATTTTSGAMPPPGPVLRPQTTRSGRTTKVPQRYSD